MGDFWQWFSARDKEDSSEASSEDEINGFSLQLSFEDLATATANFAQENWIGAGAAGDVFRGCIHGGTEVAVKVLKEGAELADSFFAEVEVLSRFRHPNLVLLLGWGEHRTRGTKLLVYELMPGGSIGQRLYRSRLGVESFPWNLRIRSACDAACGLSYMVNSRPRAFHRDIKPANILLDSSGVAKVADFGLASLTVFDDQSRLAVENVSGTPGYVCPEYARTGEVTEKSEVYSFGVVLLELLVNDELPARLGSDGGLIFPLFQMLRPWEDGALSRLLMRLDRNAAWPGTVATSLGALALQCVHGDLATRPCFAEIAEALRRIRNNSDSSNHNMKAQSSHRQKPRISDQLRAWAAANPPVRSPHAVAKVANATISHRLDISPALQTAIMPAPAPAPEAPPVPLAPPAPPAAPPLTGSFVFADTFGVYSETDATPQRFAALPRDAMLRGETLLHSDATLD